MNLIGDRYALSEIIGTGGMSEVYAADDTLLGRGVAIKMLRPELARDASFRERFRREAQNSGKLNHPSIVAVYDTGEAIIDGSSIPYIVMERVHGRTLRQVVREDGSLTPARAAEILHPVGNALQASHDASIIHRDVKPANIMITNTGTVKVMDFGIARAIDDATSAMTQTSAVIGTAQYLSPEQARGKPADARSDVYALGCVLYEIITGRPPFEGETPFAVAYQHVQDDPTPPSEIVEETLSPTAAVNIDAVVLTAMAKHPADRYQTAAAMAEDLERLSRNAVTEAARHHITAPEDESPTVVTAPVATAYDKPSPTPQSTPEPSTPTMGSETHRQENRGTRWLAWVAGLLAIVALGIGGAFFWDLSQNRTENSVTEQTITIPDVVGMERADAINELEELRLRVDVNEEPNPEVPRGVVFRSNPIPGSQLQPGTAVTLTVSSGREITDVPDLTGMSPQEAAEALQGVDLELRQQVNEVDSDTIRAGLIVEQSPAAGSQLSKGSNVSITISRGPAIPPPVRVPSLTGMQLSQAEETLSSMDLTPNISSIDSMEPEGQVLSVENEGNTVPVGSTVSLQVSNGMLIDMPDIIREDRSSALNMLHDAGWTGTDSQLVTGEPVRTGALIDQGLIAAHSPSPATPVRKDANITVRYWEFDVGALVPGN